MSRRPRRRFATVIAMVLSLLFAQLALAAYVCPGQEAAADMQAMMAAGMPCEGMDDQQPALCHQHHAGSVQSAEAVKLPSVAPAALVLALQVPLVLQPAENTPAAVSTGPEARPPPDPLFLSTLRLRV